MLGVLLNSAPDNVNKSLRFTQALTKESLESLPGNRNVNLVLYLMLMFLSAEQDGIFQEGSCKWNSVWTRGIGGGKVIFALLKEIVILHIRYTSGNCAFKSLSQRLSKCGAMVMTGAGTDVRDLESKMVLTICWRSSSKYLTMDKSAESKAASKATIGATAGVGACIGTGTGI